MAALYVLVSVVGIMNGLELEKPARIIEGDYGYLEGFVVHGNNNLNGNPFLDFSNLGFAASYNTPMYSVQVLNDESNCSEPILPIMTTERGLPLATGPQIAQILNMVGYDVTTPDDDIWNIPILEIGTITSSSRSIDDRFTLKAFDEVIGSELPANYYPHGAKMRPTLADWEMASGLIEIVCDESDNTAIVSVTMCNALPSSLYTIYESVINKPGTMEEGAARHPLGGTGAVIRTDFRGYGELTVKMPWCPITECVPNESIDCTMGFMAIHQSDYFIYGAEEVPFTWKPYGYTQGLAGAPHLVWPVNGEFVQEPLNRFESGQC